MQTSAPCNMLVKQITADVYGQQLKQMVLALASMMNSGAMLRSDACLTQHKSSLYCMALLQVKCLGSA